jgi:hypothetical protein
MVHIGLSEAAKLTGKDKATIHRAMASGRLSFTVGSDGARRIDPAELERVFRIKTPDAIAPRTRPAAERNNLQPLQIDALLEAERSKTALLEATVADLRHRLDRADEERRRTQEQLVGLQTQMAALLTDQRATPTAPPPPAPRRWWNWRRQG